MGIEAKGCLGQNVMERRMVRIATRHRYIRKHHTCEHFVEHRMQTNRAKTRYVE